jgi:uncharacterized protein YecT (DUF1311 family)
MRFAAKEVGVSATRTARHASMLLLLVVAGARLAGAAAQPAAAATAAAPDAVKACWDRFEAAEWGKMTDCLQAALKHSEANLATAVKAAEAQAAQSMDKLSAQNTLKESNARWQAYRDAECDRQLAFVAGRNHPDIGELTCKIRLTDQRVVDFHFDDDAE